MPVLESNDEEGTLGGIFRCVAHVGFVRGIVVVVVPRERLDGVCTEYPAEEASRQKALNLRWENGTGQVCM